MHGFGGIKNGDMIARKTSAVCDTDSSSKTGINQSDISRLENGNANAASLIAKNEKTIVKTIDKAVGKLD